jgi:hypothetical protein
MNEGLLETAPILNKREDLRDGVSQEAEEYLAWKDGVPELMRQAVEASLLGKEPSFDVSLPKTKLYLDVFFKSLTQKKFSDEFLKNPLIKNLLSPLDRVKTFDGHMNLFEMMSDPKTSWALKRALYDTQLKNSFEWVVDKDVEDLSKNIEEDRKIEDVTKDQDKKSEHQAPPTSDESLSSMEAGGEKREGAPEAYFTVTPFFGGYAKSHIYNKFNPKTLRWAPNELNLEAIEEQEVYDKSSTRIYYGIIKGGKPVAIPLYYNFTFDISSIKTTAKDEDVKILKDERGVFYIEIDAPGEWSYEILAGKTLGEKAGGQKEELEISGELPDEIKRKIKELKAQNFPQMKVARDLVRFVRNTLVYSNSNKAWKKYSKKPDNFFTSMWKGKEADCHVSNTLALRVLNEAGVTSRFVNGHYVKDQNEKGEAIMHSGSGHAWIEVWDFIGRKWVRMDATPKGDPTVDDDAVEKDLEEPKDGDYGGDDEIMSKEEIEKKLKEAKQDNSSEGKKGTNIIESSFANEAVCTPQQAKEFLTALERVREIKNEKGEKITELLIKEWQKIIEERKIEKTQYRGPVRMSEGENLVDPVALKIDLKTRENDPTGFEKRETKEILSYDFGGINIFSSFDLSGSMTNPDESSGRAKVDVQRDSALLFVDSLMQCAFLYRREASDTDLLPLKIMATVASSIGKITLPITDKWGPKEQWMFYHSLNQCAMGGTPTHETMDLIEQAIDKENDNLKRKGVPKHKMPLNYVVEVSDGAPDDFVETVSAHDRIIKKGSVVRAYIIGGEIDRPEYSSVGSFSDLPKILSGDIIGQFKKLHPKRIKQ